MMVEFNYNEKIRKDSMPAEDCASADGGRTRAPKRRTRS